MWNFVSWKKQLYTEVNYILLKYYFSQKAKKPVSRPCLLFANTTFCWISVGIFFYSFVVISSGSNCDSENICTRPTILTVDGCRKLIATGLQYDQRGGANFRKSWCHLCMMHLDCFLISCLKIQQIKLTRYILLWA